ncbi:DNA/RNA non-specific endonuclease [Porphyromonas asaccharolytica]|uniref:DNA/RNA non-specific endonuclease n=1 Tax=Porphyromonas asaccharolytica (strain ATCC 25260 / DSM 20707 / BCRC 10618 / CCUG 7834 / JCM 6326 / LMG 13178 / VPI 4198 / B440) TaxID=879243 RepID=F4KKN7_PORAD|nr:DNA/RNA non-specific endonuclease [Porphyromonas asaccharolytica]AEE12962.1 DNA/RNA non-specific endonuclease [Porphyromonas asaccharolytica DSM 20707]
MTNRTYRLLFTLLALSWGLLLTAACQPNGRQEGAEQPQRETNQTFLASQQDYDLRVAGTAWEAGDQIGIYVRRTAQSTTWSAEQLQHSNLHYKTIRGGGIATFDPADDQQKVQWDSSMKYDILAYYPYNAQTQEGKIAYSVADQATIKPLLISDNLSAIAPDDVKQLAFRQALASLRFEMRSEDGGSLEGVKVRIVGMPTTGTLDLYSRQWQADASSTTEISVPVLVLGATATATALLLPIETTTSEMKVLFTLPNGRTYTWPLRAGQSLVMGQQRTHTITLKDTGTGKVAEVGQYLELPAKKALPNTMEVQHMLPSNSSARNYFLLYDTKMHLAHYVAYPLYKDVMEKKVDRTNAWGYDPMISEAYQPNLTGAYNRGYSRGHQIPSADRLSSRDDNASTFYYSNMVPQNQIHNSGIWGNLENQVRTLARGVDTLYVVTGVGFDDTNYQYTQDRSGVDCPIPDYFYKVVVWRDRQERWHSKAWCIPHEPLKGSPAPYQTTLSAMETKTGFDFFPALNEVNVLDN